MGCSNLTLIGDGICHVESNTAICSYDGGDCCLLSSLNTDQCLECACSTEGVITSPGFPGNYDNGLDVTWLVQVPAGFVIRVNFVSFDVESSYSC